MTPAWGWSDERTAVLRKLHAQGLSYSRIADYLGISRNAVGGKVDRLGLNSRKASAPRDAIVGPKQPHMANTFNERRAGELAQPPRTTKPQPARVKIRPGFNSNRASEIQHIEATEILDLPPDTSEFACTIGDLGTDMCRWPLGEPSADMQYCGARCVGSWCRRHSQIVWKPAGRRD